MYITGIVRASRNVRKRLQHGLSTHEVDQFRHHVQTTVHKIESICRQQGLTPGALPLPSRNAYKFLKELDLASLPVNAGGGCQTVPMLRVKVRNLFKTADEIHRQLWSEMDELKQSDSRRNDLVQRLSEHARRIEAACARQGASTGALEDRTLQLYAWIKFLAEEDNLIKHLSALSTARSTVVAKGLKARVMLMNMKSLWRYNRQDDTYLFKVHEGFTAAAPEVWDALLTVRIGDCKQQNAVVRQFAHSDQFAAISCALETIANQSTFKLPGRAHDLNRSFERLNHAYFAGQMPKPTLTWNSTFTARKFGHYDRLRDTIMISISLDDPSIPEFVIDAVMYHELLHKKLGSSFENGRRVSHGAEFRKQEKLFPRLQEAEQIIAAVARKNRR